MALRMAFTNGFAAVAQLARRLTSHRYATAAKLSHATLFRHDDGLHCDVLFAGFLKP